MGANYSICKTRLPPDQVIIVTGATSGIGYVTAKILAMLGAHVIIACRSEEKAIKAINSMNEEFLKEKSSGKSQDYLDGDKLSIEFMKVDLASLKSTMEFIQAFKSSGRLLHTLICNAGMTSENKVYTEDENEMMFQVNYLSHFLVIAHLLPIMRTSGADCRIILVASNAYEVSSFNVDKIQARTGEYGAFRYYAKSKLYQVMQLYAQHRRLAGSDVTINALHPGFVDTNLAGGSTSKFWIRLFLNTSKKLHISRTPIQGASVVINTAINPELKGVSGQYYCNSRVSTTKSFVRNEADQEALWEFTLDRLKDYLDEDIINGIEGRS